MISNSGENRLGNIEVLEGGIAPAATVTGEIVIGRAVVGACDDKGGLPGLAPLWILDAFDLEAGAATLPVVEQRHAQRRRLHPIPLLFHVLVPTCTSCKIAPLQLYIPSLQNST